MRKDIITDGLVLHLDAALSDSYSGSGDRWYDLTSNNYDASLINSPTYYTGNTPNINFNGTTQHADLGKILNYTSENFTFNYWAYFNDFSTNKPEQAGAPVFYKGVYRVNGYYDYIGSYNSSTGFISFTTSQSSANQSSLTDTSVGVLKIKTWHNISITRDGSTVTIYIDGKDRTATHGNHINPTSSADNFTLSVYQYTNYNLRSDVRIAKFMNYNRSLSAAEVWQNYTATAARFKSVKPLAIGTTTFNINIETNYTLAANRILNDGYTTAFYDAKAVNSLTKDGANLTSFWYNKFYTLGTSNKANNSWAAYSSPNMSITSNQDASYGTYYTCVDSDGAGLRLQTSNGLITNGVRYRGIIRARKTTSGTATLQSYDPPLSIYKSITTTLTNTWTEITYDFTGYATSTLFNLQQGVSYDLQMISIYEVVNHKYLLQATGSAQPTWSLPGILTFDGIDNKMVSEIWTFNQPITIYAAINQITWTNNDIMLDGYYPTNGDVKQSPFTPGINTYAGAASTTNYELAVNTWGILKIGFSGTNSFIQVNNNNPIISDAGIGNLGGFTVGDYGPGASAKYSNIAVKAIILRRKLDTEVDRKSLTNYLKEYTGI